MNIIELFEKLDLGRGKKLEFSADEIIKIEKRINVEKKLNPEIDHNVAANLVLALKNYPKEMDFLANDFLLYNFFAKTRYQRDSFYPATIDPEKIRYFIAQFLNEDVSLYFDKKMAENQFEDMEYLLTGKHYFPEDVLYKIERKIEGKIAFVIHKLDGGTPNELSEIYFIKHTSFYEFLSHFNSPEMDDTISAILNRVVSIYNLTKKEGFGESAMLAISHYKAYDDEINELLAKNVKTVRFNIANNLTNGTNSSSGFTLSGRTIFFIIIVVLKIIWALSKCSDSGSKDDIYKVDYTNGNYSGQPYQSQYPVKSNTVDSIFEAEQTTVASFKKFLTAPVSKEDLKIEYSPADLKTGIKVFKNVYAFRRTSDFKSREIEMKNDTEYDVVLLENAIKYTTIGRRNSFAARSFFLKSKESLKIEIDSTEEKSYSLYIGNDLASFGKNAAYVLPFDNASSEYRFVKLPPNANAILQHEFNFVNDVHLTQEGKQINIKSKAMSEMKNALTIKSDFVSF